MASLRKEKDCNRSGWQLQFRQYGKRRSLWLGVMSKRAAEAVARHVEELVRAGAAGVMPDASTAALAASVDGRIRETLEGWQLIDPINATPGGLRRTELQNHRPSHVVDAWLGHDYATAAKHYLQVTPDHWEAGVSLKTGDGVLGSVINADRSQSGDTADDTGTQKKHVKG
jgi:hypothetical protein